MIITWSQAQHRKCARPAHLAITHNAAGNQPDVQQQGREPALPWSGRKRGSFWNILGPIFLPSPSSPQVLRTEITCHSGCWSMLVDSFYPRCLPCISGLGLSGIRSSSFLPQSVCKGCSSVQNVVSVALFLETLSLLWSSCFIVHT